VAHYSFDQKLAQYTVGADGTLSPMSTPTVAAGNYSSRVIVSPDGRNVYVANVMDKTVSQYQVGSDGSLTPLASATVAVAGQPFHLSIEPAGHFMYVATKGNAASTTGTSTVNQFLIGSDGSLTPMATPSISVSGTGALNSLIVGGYE
jgi:DNA-binding beta-propeller fold protein YncE